MQTGVHDGCVELQDGDEGKFPLVHSRMRYGQIRGVDYEIIHQENVQVNDAGPLRNIPHPSKAVFNTPQQVKELGGRSVPPDP